MYSAVSKRDETSEGSPIEFTLKAVEQMGDGGLYLNYLAKNAKQVD